MVVSKRIIYGEVKIEDDSCICRDEKSQLNAVK